MKRIIFSIVIILLLVPSVVSAREITDGRREYIHTNDDCSVCHEEFTDPDEHVAPDWYPEFATLDGELVTIWEVDGDNCTINSGQVVPCW